MNQLYIICIVVYGMLQSCITHAQPTNGSWQGNIVYQTTTVPFEFVWQQTTDSTAHVVFKNGAEQLEATAAIWKDSLKIPLFVFDAAIVARFTDTMMEGVWIKYYKPDIQTPFTANYLKPRFKYSSPPQASIQGTWAMKFTPPNGIPTDAFGVFKQHGNKITGSVISPVGDYRYLDGVIVQDSLFLSSFDGVHAFMLKGAFKNKKWSGIMYFDPNYSEKWQATYNPDAPLTNPFKLIELNTQTYKPYYDILTAGGTYNEINSDEFEDKVIIIQLMGTWCPNSYDQTHFLTQWYKQQDTTKVKMLAIAYEPGTKNYAQRRVRQYKNDMHIPYAMYVGGRMSKAQAALAFPNINKINAFPTLVLIDKRGYIRYFASYFTGPATGVLYLKFINEFSQKVDKLLHE